MRSLIKLFSRGLCDGKTDGRHKIMISLKQYQVRKIMPIRNDCTLQGKSSANHYCQGINWKISLPLMSLVFSFKALPSKTLELKGENTVMVNTATSDLPGCEQWVLQVKNYCYFSLERAKIWDNSRMSSPCYVSRKHSQKAGWIQRSSHMDERLGLEIPSSKT